MNLADQIEAIARAATTQVVDASNEFSTTQRRLAQELAEHQAGERPADQPDDLDDLRSRLDDEADRADSVTPRILLPADMAEGSPHETRIGE
ncbi:hypothetical protein AAFP30_20115 [Gordonia sp. CPCC 205515]|uniref:hypothetical protein n=1 Tax=Gordonia sp. CPCC 205515 TaxID=3140791 RepID=UPI003AF3A442